MKENVRYDVTEPRNELEHGKRGVSRRGKLAKAGRYSLSQPVNTLLEHLSTYLYVNRTSPVASLDFLDTRYVVE